MRNVVTSYGIKKDLRTIAYTINNNIFYCLDKPNRKKDEVNNKKSEYSNVCRNVLIELMCQ